MGRTDITQTVAQVNRNAREVNAVQERHGAFMSVLGHACVGGGGVPLGEWEVSAETSEVGGSWGKSGKRVTRTGSSNFHDPQALGGTKTPEVQAAGSLGGEMRGTGSTSSGLAALRALGRGGACRV